MKLHIRATSIKVATTMKVPPDHLAINQTLERLGELLDSPVMEITDTERTGQVQCDAIIKGRKHTFALEWKRSGTLANVALAANSLREQTHRSRPRMIPLVSVPYMGERGRRYCESLDVSWLDLSGNSRITARNLYVRESGCRNRFGRRGPLASPFGPRGSRIARWLLAHPGESFRQRDLAEAAGLNKGYTSRVVRKLLEGQLITLRESRVEVDDPGLLLEAWDEAYRFDRHAITPGHITARSGIALTTDIADILEGNQIKYAMTGLPAAWLYTQYASHRLVTVYIEEVPSDELMKQLRFREDRRGANTWFVVPNDEGVFTCGSTQAGVRCVHPVQAYLDLQEHPERAAEAAEELKYRLLNWERKL